MTLDVCLVATTLAIVVPLWTQPVPSQTTEQHPTTARASAAAASRSVQPAQDIDKRVAALIKKMLNRRTEQKAFAALEALGCTSLREWMTGEAYPTPAFL
jgi:hypothetical protein